MARLVDATVKKQSAGHSTLTQAVVVADASVSQKKSPRSSGRNPQGPSAFRSMMVPATPASASLPSKLAKELAIDMVASEQPATSKRRRVAEVPKAQGVSAPKPVQSKLARELAIDMNPSKVALLDDGISALDMEWSLPSPAQAGDSRPKRKTTRVGLVARATASVLGSTGSILGKRGRDVIESGKDALSSMTNRSIRPGVEEEVAMTKKPRVSQASANAETEKPKPKPKSRKKWLRAGLYVGQQRGFDARLSEAKNKEKREAEGIAKERKILPLPMFAGAKLLETGRDFKLPFDVFSPLPKGQPKVEEWKKFQGNRFVGDSAMVWRKSKKLESSRCLCKPESGCDEDCQNRAMVYECDDGNCNIGAEHCTNRSFATLKERHKSGRLYDIGVQVMKTDEKGNGLRSCRTFEPNQIIVEYAGEIITQDECERRMLEEYKDNECYYLMTFHQNMIIDATRGSIARFINHSCDPNCRMVKWIVAGKPRMALFAGDDGIMSGEELTYDYNFDPFSLKNVQPCHCKTALCRKVLVPRTAKDKAQGESKTKALANELIAKTKRKLQQFLGSKDEFAPASKKRAIAPLPAKRRRSVSSTAPSKRIASNATGQTTLVDKENMRRSTSSRRSSTHSTDNLIRRPKIPRRVSSLPTRVARSRSRASMPLATKRSAVTTPVSKRAKLRRSIGASLAIKRGRTHVAAVARRRSVRIKS